MYDRNNDAGTFVLNIAEQGRPMDTSKMYGKPLSDSNAPKIVVEHRDERDTGEVVLTNRGFTHKRSDAGTFTLNMGQGSQITPGAHYHAHDTVSYKGTQVTAKVAANMGLLVSDGRGGFTAPFAQGSKQEAPRKQFDPTQHTPEQHALRQRSKTQEGGEGNTPPVTTEDALKEAEANGMNPMEAEVEQQFSNALSAIKPMTSRQTMLELSEGTIARLAEESGLSVEQADAVANDLYSKFETQARHTVESMGLDSDDLFEWAWENQPEMMQDAMRRHGFDRSTSGYQEIAKAYLIGLAETDL